MNAGLFYVGRVRPTRVVRDRRFNPLPPHGHRVCGALARGGGWRIVRTPGPCADCGEWFVPGDPYLDTAMHRVPEMGTYRLCITCAYHGAYGDSK